MQSGNEPALVPSGVVLNFPKFSGNFHQTLRYNKSKVIFSNFASSVAEWFSAANFEAVSNPGHSRTWSSPGGFWIFFLKKTRKNFLKTKTFFIKMSAIIFSQFRVKPSEFSRLPGKTGTHFRFSL